MAVDLSDIETEAAKFWTDRLRRDGLQTFYKLGMSDDGFAKATLDEFQTLRPIIDQNINPASENSILDFACGAGRYLPFFHDFNPYSGIVGFDICREALVHTPDLARVHVFPGPWDDARDIIWCFSPFKLIFSCRSLGCIPTPALQHYARDLTQMLDVNGCMLFIEHLGQGAETALYRHRTLEVYNEIFAPVSFVQLPRPTTHAAVNFVGDIILGKHPE